MPCHAFHRMGDHIPFPGGDGDDMRGLNPYRMQILRGFFGHALKGTCVIPHRVHLIDHHRNLTHPKQVQKIRMAARLLLHPLGCIHHQNSRIRLRCAGNHVLEELTVTWRINNHIVACIGGEPDLRRVNRDRLIALRLKCIQDKRPLQRIRTAFLADILQLLILPVRQGTGIIEQATYKR